MACVHIIIDRENNINNFDLGFREKKLISN